VSRRVAWRASASRAHVDAVVALAADKVLLWTMIAYDVFFVCDERRFRLRHGLDLGSPG
jgi:hypothetical protein